MKLSFLAQLFAFILSSFFCFSAVQINSEQDLLDLMNQNAPFDDWSADYELTTDLDMSGYNSTTTPATKPIGQFSNFFSGTFDGNGYVIRNLVMDSGNDHLALFDYINNGAVIKDLGLENVEIYAGFFAAGMCIYPINSTIINCYVTGKVTAQENFAGGFCTENWNSTIKNCYASVETSGKTSVGGFVAWNTSGDIRNCFATGDVTSTDEFAGGFCGNNYSGIYNCYSTGDVNGIDRVGGFSGLNNLDIVENCYSTGDVSGVNNIGGFSGDCEYGDISYCYSTGKVTCSNTFGGFCGEYDPGSLTCCYWNKGTSGTDDGVGSVDPDPSGVTGLSNSEFLLQSSFSCFDFENKTWVMAERGPILFGLAIPTLTEWAAIAFICLLVGTGGWYLWRNNF